PRGIFLRNLVIGKGGLQAGGTVRGDRVLIDGEAIRGRDVYLRRATNVVPGVGARDGRVIAERQLVLTDSVVIDNEEREGRPDLTSGRRPRLLRTVCGRSARLDDAAATWDVCRDD